MKLGYGESLFLVAFDHRSSFSRGLFGASEPLPPGIVAKSQRYQGGHLRSLRAGDRARRAAERSAGSSSTSSSAPRSRARQRRGGFLLAMPVEQSGQLEFQLEYGEDFGRHIEAFDPDFSKVLVRYNPEGDRALNARQTQKLARLSSGSTTRERKFLFELLVPATPEQLERCGGQERYDRELRGAPRRRRGARAASRRRRAGHLEDRGPRDGDRLRARGRAGASRGGSRRRGLHRPRTRREHRARARVAGDRGAGGGLRRLRDRAHALAGRAREVRRRHASTREETRDEIADRYLSALTAYVESSRRGRIGTAPTAARGDGERETSDPAR